jgi:hypothetical protein
VAIAVVYTDLGVSMLVENYSSCARLLVYIDIWRLIGVGM